MEFVSPPPTVRRNPPRKAKTPASNPPENLAPARRPPLRSIHPNIQQNEAPTLENRPQQKKPSNPAEECDILRVFLRIRPPKPVALKKNSGAANPGKNVEAAAYFLVTNDSRSVVLKAPPSIADPKRIKSEIFDGFSYVFSPQSSQVEVYQRTMQPLVMDFLGGSSRLLVVMGPTGTGKTHTVFGSMEEPGLVPLALGELFRHSSIYHISMFEIYSDQGRGERIFDLFQGGTELALQQSSTVKGLHEAKVVDIKHAECMIANGMARRTTAETNANNQSSRSQCIINIRKGSEMIAKDNSSADAVLTIADLAGTERERRTGIQGKRLLESGFINNTSMVLGLCLRALFEHQQNKKKQLQKHFHGSLLTRYLREYLEAKKRMALILTAGAGEHDYSDTSFLLRQASPYTRIRFDIVKESTNISKKRHTGTENTFSSSKRRKCDDVGSRSTMTEQLCGGDNARDPSSAGECQQIKERGETSSILIGDQSKPHEYPRLNSLYTFGLKRRARMGHIMQKFARALWTVLKEYKEKLVVSDNELKNLRISFEREQSRAVEMEKQLVAFQASCSCLKGSISISDPIEANTSGICCNGSLGTVATMLDGVDVSHDFLAREEKEDNMLNVDHMPLSCSTCPDVADTNPLPTNSDASFGQSHATSVLLGRVAIGEAQPITEIDCELLNLNENNHRTGGALVYAPTSGSSNAEVPVISQHCLLTIPIDGRLLEMQHVAHDTHEDCDKGGVALVNATTSEAGSSNEAVTVVSQHCLATTEIDGTASSRDEVPIASGDFSPTTLNDGKLLEMQHVSDDTDESDDRIGSDLVNAPTSEIDSSKDAVPVVSQPSLPLSIDSHLSRMDVKVSTSTSTACMTSNECVGPVGKLLEELTGITLNEFREGLWENNKHCMSKISTISKKYGNKFEKIDIDRRCSMEESHCLRCCFVLIHNQALQNEGKLLREESRENISRLDFFHAITWAPSVARAIHHVRMLETERPDSTTISSDIHKHRRRLLPASSMLKDTNCFNTNDEYAEDGSKAAGARKVRVNKYMETQGRMELIRLLKGSQPM